MSRSLSRWQAIVLGVFVFLALGLAGFGLFAVGGKHWPGRDSFHVRAGFQNTQGIVPGTAVRIQGVEAGEVEAVLPPANPGDLVVLRLQVRGAFRHLVGPDAHVQILSEGMIGAKVVDIVPGTSKTSSVEEDALLASQETADLNKVLAEVTTTLKSVRDGQGVLGTELVGALRQTRATMASVQRVGDAGKEVPILRNYIKDPQDLLVRPDCECNRYVFGEADLFEPGRAVLTTEGRQRLNDLVPRLHGLLKHDRAEMVVASLADPKSAVDRDLALGICKRQSEAVSTYLQDQKVQKATWLTSRKVTALGFGTDGLPGEVQDPKNPPARLELLVFVPQN